MDPKEAAEMVAGPGKFEGERSCIPYFWEQVLGGSSTEEIYIGDDVYSLFLVEDADRALFPGQLDGIHAVIVWETDNGFVSSAYKDSKAALEAWLEAAEAAQEAQDAS